MARFHRCRGPVAVYRRDTLLNGRKARKEILFEDEFYLKSQIETLKETLELIIMKYNPVARLGTTIE